MGLYDRDYVKNKTTVSANDKAFSETAQSSEYSGDLATFIKQTYQLFAGSLLVGAAGAYVGMGIPAIREFYWGFVILEFALIFGIGFARAKPGLNLIMLFAFALVSGLTMSVLVGHFISAGAGGVVANALILTTVAFGGLSMFAMNTERDFTTMGKMLFITLIVIIVAGLLNVFWLHSPWMQVGIASVSAILFSAFILYDTQNIIQGNYGHPVDGALALYLDFINLFTSLLQILGILGSDE
jgi:modulator of FtsH protease